MNDYTKQAEQFLADTGTVLAVEYLRTAPYFQGDKGSRDIYRFTLTNARGSYSSEFGDSINNTQRRACVLQGTAWHEVKYNDKARKLGILTREDAIAARHAKPTAYDILACIEKYQPEPIFAEWARELGYDDAPMRDYPKIQAIHQACLSQYAGIARLFTADQMVQLQEIN